jgi:hypothetical protein
METHAIARPHLTATPVAATLWKTNGVARYPATVSKDKATVL